MWVLSITFFIHLIVTISSLNVINYVNIVFQLSKSSQFYLLIKTAFEDKMNLVLKVRGTKLTQLNIYEIEL